MKALATDTTAVRDDGVGQYRPSAERAAAAERSGADYGTPQPAAGHVVLALFDLRMTHCAWGWSRFVVGASPLTNGADARFGKILGSGHRGGFGLRPSFSRVSVICAFSDRQAADEFATASPLLDRYRCRSAESLVITLDTTSCRGSWNGFQMSRVDEPHDNAVVASLTRASIRPRSAWAFWADSPPAEQSLARAAGCRLAVGLGEAPLLRQATFSIWHSVAAMDAYARTGAHLKAIRDAREQRFFTESMFARFNVRSVVGRWGGQNWA
jgi:hypothetical protein